MRLGASEIAGASQGRLVGDDVAVTGVAIDSRLVRGGELFVPVVAERDGHQFVAAAAEAGASAYLSGRGAVVPDVARIEVADTAAALLDIGRLARSHLPERVVAVTGSVGKTSVKDLTAAALSRSFTTAASERSFNNELGVPLTLANAPEGTEAVVVEMGARGAGHISLLCGVARPTIGIVTVVAAAHTEMFGTVDDVAAAKGELVEALPSGGTAVLNAADPRVVAMRKRATARVLTFSGDAAVPADVTAAAVELDEELRPAFRLVCPWGEVDVRLAVHGAHNVGNALAAAGAALAAGADLAAVADGLGAAQLSPWRMELGRSLSGLLVLNDSYNANPTSMEAALVALAGLDARRRVAVLGLMAELGDLGPAAHRRLAARAAELGIEVVAVGTDLYGAAPVAGPAEAAAALAELGLGRGDAVLIKGSRMAGLEQVARSLLEA
jgi:UDP-N-acetylmuramoyl-tripeptide--D-alanyl-D-alanine ligase